jgi:transcriptional regulator with XRE-family HTH domain
MGLDVIKNSGLRQKNELEGLLGVTRMTLFKYFHGRATPRKEVADRITHLASLINKLTEKGFLPFTEDTDEEDRKVLVGKIKNIMYPQ